MTGWQVFRKESFQPRSVVVLAVLALCGGPLFAAETSASPGTARHEFITLTNITPERGREFLSRLKMATASKLPGTNALLVTAESGELQKAVAVLNLVDSRTEFDIKELGPAAGKQIPSHAQIAAAVGGVSIGTFANPPQDKSKMRAIVDVHHGTIVVIAPVFQLRDIKLAVELGPEALMQKRALAKTTKESPGLKPPGSNEPADSGAHAGQTVGTATSDSSQTIQATAMPESPFSGEISGGVSDAGSTRAKTSGTSNVESQTPIVGQHEELTPKKETQQKLPDVREPTAELKAEPEPLSESSTKPQPAAPANPQATGSKPAEAQSTTPPPEPSQPAQPNEPVVAEPTSAQPGQAVPSGPTPVAQTQTQPQPQPQTTPVAASSAAPQAQATVSPFRPVEAVDGDKVLDLTLPERMPVIYLLDLVGKHLGLSYVYNPEDVKGEVSLKLNGDLHGNVRVKDLYPLLEQSLRQLNLITTRHKGNVVAIVPAARVMEIDPPLIDRNFPRVESGDTAVTSKFELKHIETAAAKNLLDGMKLGLDVTAIPEKHLLIVTAYAYRMERIERLLQMVDQPGEPKKFRFRQLRYTMAKTLAEKVKAMAEQMLESVSVTVAEPDVTPSLARQPGENDASYRTRVAAFRAQQTQQQAALRAQQQALRGQIGAAETKQSVFLDADERTNRVLMIGAEKQLVIVEQLVDALDVQQQDLRALQLYRILHVDAEDVARKLQELGIISKLPDGSTTASSRYPTTAARITPQLPGQPRLPNAPTPDIQIAPNTEVTEKGLVEEPQVVVVEATNSLLVNATAEQHAKIAHIIEYVDSETLTNEIPYKIYPLENSSPKHLSEVLQSLIQETVEQQKEGGKIEKVVVNKDEKIKIVPDPNTYSLIVYANKRNQEWIATLITQLDKRRPQVLIDVTLVAITKTDKFDYDLNLLRGSPSLASTSTVPGLAPVGGNAVGKAVGTGGGLTAFYGDNQVQALLDTVQEKTYGRVLAKPKLLVNDNEKGKVDTKDITYVEVTGSSVVGSGVPGATGGLVQSSTSFNSYDAGITLDITPHISEGDLLRLDIKLTRSDFGTILGTRPPDKKSSEVETAVTLPNGTTVILGGMLKMNQSKGGKKVPILGDIPLVGGLFRGIHNSQIDENLYMFVKAEIIRPDETSSHGMKGLEVLSERNRQAFEKHELEFQTNQDWPGIKSKRIEPSKVLDAQ
jgi:general secretion pathway protein D